MAFMVPEVTLKMKWVDVDTSQGGYYIPLDVLTSAEVAAFKRGDFTPLLQYTEAASNADIYSAEIIKGYGVRLTAPGYMDATEWEVFSTEREADERAAELEEEQNLD